jgi:hypothetical protein
MKSENPSPFVNKHSPHIFCFWCSFYCRITKASDTMSLSSYKELAIIESTLCDKAKTALHQIFKAGKGGCVTTTNLNCLVTFKLSNVPGVKDWPLFQRACLSNILAYCDTPENILAGLKYKSCSVTKQCNFQLPNFERRFCVV